MLPIVCISWLKIDPGLTLATSWVCSVTLLDVSLILEVFQTLGRRKKKAGGEMNLMWFPNHHLHLVDFCMVNVGKYTINGCYGIVCLKEMDDDRLFNVWNRSFRREKKSKQQNWNFDPFSSGKKKPLEDSRRRNFLLMLLEGFFICKTLESDLGDFVEWCVLHITAVMVFVCENTFFL